MSTRWLQIEMSDFTTRIDQAENGSFECRFLFRNIPNVNLTVRRHYSKVLILRFHHDSRSLKFNWR